MSDALFEYLIRLGDERLVLGHKLSEWCGYGPILEELGTFARSHKLPYHVLLELTYGCNLRCVMCYNPTHTASNELTLAEYERLFDELMSLGTVQLTFT